MVEFVDFNPFSLVTRAGSLELKDFEPIIQTNLLFSGGITLIGIMSIDLPTYSLGFQPGWCKIEKDRNFSHNQNFGRHDEYRTHNQSG